MKLGIEADYDRHLYPTRPHADLHLDNLFSAAYLRGYHPVPVERARVLEIGCGDGMHLIPMALDFPEGEFVGVDYARVPIQNASAAAEELAVSNVRFHQADVRELAEDFGEFDYILAHGFYSWVPEDVREAFWRVAGGSMGPKGILLVSYNALPGWRRAENLRDFAAFHMSRIARPEDRIEGVWLALSELARTGDTENALVREAFSALERGFAVSIHDQLSATTKAFYLREVSQRARENGFRYVCDSQERMRPGLHQTPAMQEFLASHAGDDVVARAQYEDFLTMNNFRRSIFARQEPERVHDDVFGRIRQLWLSTPLRAAPAGANGIRRVEAPNVAVGFETADRMVCALFDDLEKAAPSNIHIGRWVETALEQHPEWRGTEEQAFQEFLKATVSTGICSFYPRAIEAPAGVPARPKVRPLNRWEARRDGGITNLFHRVVMLSDPLESALLQLLDGERDHRAIVEALASEAMSPEAPPGACEAHPYPGGLALRQSRAFHGRQDVFASEGAVYDVCAGALPSLLEAVHRLALLVD